MIPYPDIDPVALHLGPFAIRWYGIMYLAGFIAGYLLVKKQVSEDNAGLPLFDKERFKQELQHIEGLIFYLVLGVIIGGRLGYVLFYNLPWYMKHPADIFATWHGGMSFHGGAAGAVTAGWLYCHKNHLNFMKWADRFIITAPVGLGLGRIGNFINGELFGRPTKMPWGMIFPNSGLVQRHPSQIYEALLEGVLLFSILWPLRRRNLPAGTLTGLFFILYALCRLTVEFFREPDRQIGFILGGWMTMGQLLSLVLLPLGVAICFYAIKSQS